MSLLSWNCRGLKSLSSQTLGFISNIASSNNLDFIFLSETKCHVFLLEPSFSRLGFYECSGFNSDGSKGGLFLCWTRRVVIEIVKSSANYVCCKTADEAGNEYFIAFVYGSPYLANRSEIWDNMSKIMEENKGLWLLIGDFNQVENKDKKLGGSLLIQGASSFIDWKFHNNLLDIPYQGVNFTWSNNRSNAEAIYERIDKAFCNVEWKDKFTEAEIWNLPILLSEHSPIILQIHGAQDKRKKRPYILDAWSLNFEEVRDIIREEWAEAQEGSSSFILQRKLQNSLRRIRSWCLEFKERNKIDWKDIKESLWNIKRTSLALLKQTQNERE